MLKTGSGLFTNRPISELDFSRCLPGSPFPFSRSDLLRFVRLVFAVPAVALFRGAVEKAVHDGVWRGGGSSGAGGVTSSIVAVGQ